MISEWFFSYYTNMTNESSLVILRVWILLVMVAFVSALVYNYATRAYYTPDHEEVWALSTFFALLVAIASFVVAVGIPGILGGIFWALFL